MGVLSIECYMLAQLTERGGTIFIAVELCSSRGEDHILKWHFSAQEALNLCPCLRKGCEGRGTCHLGLRRLSFLLLLYDVTRAGRPPLQSFGFSRQRHENTLSDVACFKRQIKL